MNALQAMGMIQYLTLKQMNENLNHCKLNHTIYIYTNTTSIQNHEKVIKTANLIGDAKRPPAMRQSFQDMI